MKPGWAGLSLACLMMGGCAAVSPAAGSLTASAPAQSSLPGRAERIAEALAQAADAERTDNDAALAQAAQRLERLGAVPQDEAAKAILARWHAKLPTDAEPLRGRALGPAFRAAVLDPGAVTELNQTFLGGRSAKIVVRATRGSAPLLVVHDQANREVCKAHDNPITCRWVPLYTQRHRIEISNTGEDVSEFYIVFD